MDILTDVNHEAHTVREALGITEERDKEIRMEIVTSYMEEKPMTGRINRVLRFVANENEKCYALFQLGDFASFVARDKTMALAMGLRKMLEGLAERNEKE